MIFWGGYPGLSHLLANPAQGLRYNPVSDTWSPMTTNAAPVGRSDHTAVWTGSEMIVWGGSGWSDGSFPANRADGGRYNPTTDTWRSVNFRDFAPPVLTTAVWTGKEMIVWGGAAAGFVGHSTNTGARYDPSNDTWFVTPLDGAPSPRAGYSAIWTGSEMIIWGGFDPERGGTNDGARYRPAGGCAPTPPAEDRKVIFIQGIDSEGDSQFLDPTLLLDPAIREIYCRNRPRGFLNINGENSVKWMVDTLKGKVASLDSER